MILVAASILAVSCETESLVVKNAPQDNVSVNPVLRENVLRISQHPTAIDNLIDGTDCFSILFPYRVMANGQEVVLNSVADYQQVRDIFNTNPDDIDTIAPIFPVRVQYTDYSESVFTAPGDFAAAKSNCEGTAELSCLKLQYPLKMEWFNWQEQSGGVLELANAKALFKFIDNMNPETVASFSYPLRLITPDAVTLIASNTQMEQVINSYIENCTPSDPGPVNPNPLLEEILASGSWYVSYFFRQTDQTSDYTAYDFTFNTDGTASATGEPAPIGGTWVTFTEDGQKHLFFVFNSNALEEMEESWIVTEFSQTTVKMRYESGGSGTRYLNLTRN